MSHLQAIPMTAQHIPFLHGLFQDPVNKEALHARDFTLSDWREAFATSQTDSDEELFIIMQDNKPAAWLKINGLDGDTAWIAMLVVDSRRHREGIGSFAVRYAEDYVIGRGFRQMGIHTTDDNIAAQECYIKAGYKITDSGECQGSDCVSWHGFTLMKSFWFHGSPLELDELRSGSTITQWKAHAEAFSHKPSILEYDHVVGEIKHNCSQPGFLYLINEPITEGVDVHKHSNTSMDDGAEWLTNRPLKLRLLASTEMSLKKPIKMIVTDLDRTLLRTDKTISDYTADVLNRCRERGIMVVFATARYFRTINEWLVPTIGFHPDIVISSNGAFAYSENKVWYSALIEPELANKMIAGIRRRGGQITIGTSRIRLSERPIEQTHILFSASCDFQTPITDDVHYIDYGDGYNIAEDITSLFPQVRLQSYVDSLTTFVHKNARKGLALQEIMRQRQITTDEVIGFGDDVNDLDFLRVCGMKIAVGNAVGDVKKVADFVCPSNDEDGVACWLEENVL